MLGKSTETSLVVAEPDAVRVMFAAVVAGISQATSKLQPAETAVVPASKITPAVLTETDIVPKCSKATVEVLCFM